MTTPRGIAVILLALLGMLLAGATIGEAQQSPDPRVADIVKAGKLRVGFGLGGINSAVKDATTGEIRGPNMDLARALAAKIGVTLETVGYARSGSILDGARTDAWDLAFLVADPARTTDVDFSPPFMQTDFTYLVPSGSRIRTVEDADQSGVRIAVPRGDASELYLSRTLKRAELIRTESIAQAVELLRTGKGDAYAGPRPTALDEADRLPGSRVLEDRFGIVNRVAVVPKGKAERLAYISEFIEDAKASGLLQRMIEMHKLRGMRVAPAGHAGPK